MCGIVAYVGHRQASDVIIKGLKRLEYRGYDSTGIALLNGALNVYKKKGKVSELESYLKGLDLNSHIGMGHTRWATHGEPNDENAHPHYSATKKLAIIHNGIIENYASLKKELTRKGQFFMASDATPIIEYTNEVIYLNDQEIAIIDNGKLTIKNVANLPLTPYIQTVDMQLEAIEKSGFEHFMLKEIFEQPRSIKDCMRGRLDSQK